MIKYDPLKTWSGFYKSNEMAYPVEFVIRIFKGSYPRLNLDKAAFSNQKICDIGCGDGRNLVLLKQCGFNIYGVEITQEIVNAVINNLKKFNIEADVRVGFNHKLPFENEFFDYILSWNSCYYMGNYHEFNDYVKEYARVLKPNGFLILSIPKKSCFIYHDSEVLRKGYRIIRNDPFKLRNGEILRMFEDDSEIESVFNTCFYNFIFASIHDDCFGYDYHWHIVVCQKKGK